MKSLIPQRLVNLIIFLGIFIQFSACNASTASHLKSYKKKYLKINDQTTITVYIAETRAQQKRGLSKIKSEDFSVNEAMLFPEKEMFVRQFWMPETHFDLDLIFMNQDYYVLEVQRGLKHYPKAGDRSVVPLSKKVFSQHVLEIRSDAPWAGKIKPGMSLKLKDNAN